jgi:8-amino-3,8-dideoxy-alpha-D-manno-octulosonate transaminase
MQNAGLKNLWRVTDYGLHVYYNIPSLVRKVPLSPAGNPWSLAANKESCYDYAKGACPISDDLFERSVVITIPSRLTEDHEKSMAEIIRSAVRHEVNQAL